MAVSTAYGTMRSLRALKEQSQTSSENFHGFEPVVFLSEENRRIFQQAADIVHDLEQLGDNPKKCTETI